MCVLQKPAQKAYPESGAKEFDCILKGCFNQALLPKWQCKSGAPKTDESFEDLYTRPEQLNNMISKLGQEDNWIRGIVSPVRQMSPPRRQTQQVSQRRARIGTVSHTEMPGTRVEVVSTAEKQDTFSAIVQS